VRSALEELTAAYQAAGQSFYAQQQAAGDQPAADGAAPEAEKKQDDVVEADYEIVDDKKKS